MRGGTTPDGMVQQLSVRPSKRGSDGNTGTTDAASAANALLSAGVGEVWIMEAPRHPGAVYGEEYRAAAAREIAAALKRGDPEEASRLARENRVVT